MKKFKIEYKWVIVLISFLIIFTCLGFCSSNAGLYTKPITEGLNISRSAYSLVKSLRFISTAIANMFFGSLILKYGPKKLICVGILSLIASVLIYSFATNVYVFYIGGCFLGFGFAFAGTTMVSSVVNRWFDKNKGTVMGIILSANGIGGALAAQIVTPIIESSAFGYRNAYRLIACILAVLIVLVIIFFKEEPKNYDGDRTVHKRKKMRGREWVGIEYNELKKLPYYYLTLICIFLTGFVLHAIGDAATVQFEDVGVAKTYVATVLSVHSLVLTVSKFLTGFMYDKKGIKFTMIVCSVSSIISTTAAALVTNSFEGKVFAMIYGAMSSLALPLETIMLPIYVGDLFGQKSFDKVLGLIASFNVAGYALASPCVNLVYDICGSYIPALIGCSAIMVFVLVTMNIVIVKAYKVREKITAEYEENIAVSEVTE